MHMLSKKDLNLAELESVRVSRTPTKVNAGTGEVQTNEEATVYVNDSDLSVTVEVSPAVPSLGKLCEDHGYHCCENNYRFDALQTNCFGINIKL